LIYNSLRLLRRYINLQTIFSLEESKRSIDTVLEVKSIAGSQSGMYEALINAGPTAQLIQSPIPSPNANQVVIKVVVSGSNPKDWKLPQWGKEGINQGDDIAGTVHEVGANVTEFKVCLSCP
jgi:D-arabinose 1-dehydrogenase-like Zn-dependent alcohol dehydrogenase